MIFQIREGTIGGEIDKFIVLCFGIDYLFIYLFIAEMIVNDS